MKKSINLFPSYFNEIVNILISFIVLFGSYVVKGQSASTFTATDIMVTNTLTSVGSINGQRITAGDTLRATDHVVAEQDLELKGNLKIAGRILFNGSEGITYLGAPNSTAQAQYFFGKQANPSLPLTFPPTPLLFSCPGSTLTEGADPKFNFNGMLNSYAQNANIDASMHMGMAGWGSGMIEVGGNYNNQNSPGLLINYFCGRNVAICTGANGGKVYVGDFFNVSKHIEISYPAYPNADPNNVSLEISTNAGKGIKFNTYNNALPIISVSNSNFLNSPFTVLGNGRTNIGSGRPLATGVAANAMLTVDGMILAKDIRVAISNTHWADYVFDKGYKLMSLTEVEKFVLKNKHLPEIPSSDLVKEDGVDLLDMNVKLLKKIEELYLYTIELKKQLDIQKAKIKKIEEAK